MTDAEFVNLIASPHPAPPSTGYIVSCTGGDGATPMWVDRVSIDRGMREIRYTLNRKRARSFEKTWAERLRDSLYQPGARIEGAP